MVESQHPQEACLCLQLSSSDVHSPAPLPCYSLFHRRAASSATASLTSHYPKLGESTMKTSTGPPSSSSPLPMVANAMTSIKDSSSSLGTLWTMRRSPFCSSIKVVLHLSGRRADEVPFVPLLSYFSLLLHLGLSALRTKLTVPILKTNARPSVYRDSLSIAAYIDACRDEARPSLFPTGHDAAIARFSEHANTLSSFMRAMLLERLWEDTDTAQKMFMPRPLRGRFFSRLLVRFAI